MKTAEAARMAGAIAPVIAGFGFGVAQAARIHSERPVLSFADMEALGQGGSSSSYVESRPVLGFDDEEDDRLATSPAGDMHLQIPVEAGRLPSGSDAESSLNEAGGVK